MPSYQDERMSFGNLQHYKFYIRPTAQRLFGKTMNPKNKHSEMVQKLLELLAIHGPGTTWQLAKIQIPNDIEGLRTKEKEYRRLLIGRNDRGKHYPGLLELGLVVQDGFHFSRGPSNRYRLSLHGILYSIDLFNFSETQMNKVAENYNTVLPKIFENWELVKKIEPKTYNKLKALSRGLLLDNFMMVEKAKQPLNELMAFLQIKYQKNYESITERDLAEQISYWFYTSLLSDRVSKKTSISKLVKVLRKNQELYSWYMKFYKEAKSFYEKRLELILKFNA